MTRQRRGREAGLAAAALLLAALLYTLFAAPAVRVTSDGSYANVMDALRLTWAGEPAKWGEVVQQFAYLRYDFASLLSPGQNAIAYPAALVRLATAPFGLPFDTRWLACAYGLMMALGVYLGVSGLYRRSRGAAAAAGSAMILLVMDPNMTGYLNSLYAQGTAIACLTLFLGCVISALCSDQGAGLRPVFKVLAGGCLLAQSQPQMAVMIPAVAVCAGLTIRHAWPIRQARPLYCLLTAFCLFTAGISIASNLAAQKDISSDATNHLAMFQGYLSAADEPEAVLAGFGLDASYAQDVGKSYYGDASAFSKDPRTDQTLLAAIRLGNRVRYCLRHPELIRRLIADKANHYLDPLNGRVRYEGWEGRYIRPSVYVFLRLLAGEGGFEATTWRMLAAACALLLLGLCSAKGLRKLYLGMAAFFLSAATYLPMSMVLTGGLDVSLTKVIFFYLGWMGLLTAAAALVMLGQQALDFLAARDAALVSAWRDEQPEKNPADWLTRLRISRKGLMWLCASLAIGMCCVLLLPSSHIGGVNNGDYGRMMEQMDLFWTPERSEIELRNPYGDKRVVEEYAYREPFHPERQTSADPTYSLIFVSMAVRLWSLLTGAYYSTWVQAWLLLALTLSGVLLIVHDLYPKLGRAAILPGLLLVTMLFGENYVAWYNSLYGESMIPPALIWVIACAIHLALKPRAGKGSLLWLAALAVSVRMLTCSKAQLLLALPAGLLLLAVFAWYHRPPREAKSGRPFAVRMGGYALAVLLLCGLVTWDSIGVYRKNDTVSSKQTVWQSVFFGALMIAEDADASMEELGLNPELRADIGKHAYHADADYVYPILSEEAETEIFDKINAFTMIRYYLHHPKDLLTMLNRAAQESVHLHTAFMAYSDERYEESQGLYRLNAWRHLRPLVACRAFWQYALLYGAALAWCIRLMLQKDRAGYQKLLALVFLCVMMIGALQYPLTVIGNGFADNNKQLYTFMLCHDLLIIAAGTFVLRGLIRKALGRETVLPADAGKEIQKKGGEE